MITNSLARKAVLVEYSLLRTPLSALDRGLAARAVADDSPVRVALGRGLGTLDRAAGRLLGNPAATSQSAPADAEPAPAAAESAPAEAEPVPAAAESASADAQPAPAEAEPAAAPVVAPEDEVERVAEELRADLDEAPLAGELADADADEKQRMADLRAKHIVEEYEEQQRAKQAPDA